MTTIFFTVIIFLWSFVIIEIMRAPCVDDLGRIIPNSSVFHSIIKFIKTKIKW
jgi:hypothetical protein